MKTVFPKYYKHFKCLANKCKHSCCIGWEIDIDEYTFEYYSSLGGDFGETVRNCISCDGVPHFVLDKNERCPFLNQNGLCNIILNLGEDALCDICAQHPRFTNYYDNCMEIGLGLCCEAACELILKDTETFKLENFNLNNSDFSKEQTQLLSLRCKLIDIMTNRHIPIKERHENMLALLGIKFPERSIKEWCDFLLSLERLDPNWTDLLTELKASHLEYVYNGDYNCIEIEQLTVYFLYRYMSNDSFDIVPKQALCFAILSTRIILALQQVNKGDITEYARMYSSEIEYSDENVIKICNEFC